MSIVFPPQPRPSRAVADPTRCPLCVAPLAGPHCQWCNADLTSEAAQSAWQASLAVDANQQWRHRKLVQLRDETAARVVGVATAGARPAVSDVAHQDVVDPAGAGQVQPAQLPDQGGHQCRSDLVMGQGTPEHPGPGLHGSDLASPAQQAAARQTPSRPGRGTSATTILVGLGAWLLGVMAAITLAAVFVGADDSGRFMTSAGLTVILGVLAVARSAMRSASGAVGFSSLDHAVHSLLGIFLINTALLGPQPDRFRLLATAGYLAAALVVTVVLGRFTRHPSYLVMLAAMAPVCAVVLTHGGFHATAVNPGHNTWFLFWEVVVHQPAQMSAALAAGLLMCAAIINNDVRIVQWMGPAEPVDAPGSGRRMWTSVAIGVELVLAAYLVWWITLLVADIATGGPVSRIAALAIELGVTTVLCAVLAPIHTGSWIRRVVTTAGAVCALATAATVAAVIHGGFGTWWVVAAPALVAAAWLVLAVRVRLEAWVSPVSWVAMVGLAAAVACAATLTMAVVGQQVFAAVSKGVIPEPVDVWQVTVPVVLIWAVAAGVAADATRAGRWGPWNVPAATGTAVTVAMLTGGLSYAGIVCVAADTLSQVAASGYLLVAAMVAMLAAVVVLTRRRRWESAAVATTSVVVSPTITAAVVLTWASDGWPIAATVVAVAMLLLAAARFQTAAAWVAVPVASLATVAVAQHCLDVLPSPALSAELVTALTAGVTTLGAAVALPEVSGRLARLAGAGALPARSQLLWLFPMVAVAVVVAGPAAITAVWAPAEVSMIEAVTAAQLIAGLVICWRIRSLPWLLRLVAGTAAAFLANGLVVSQGLQLLPERAVTSLAATGVVALVHMLWAVGYLAVMAGRTSTRHVATWGSHVILAVVLAVETHATDASRWLVLVLAVCSAPWAIRPQTPLRPAAVFATGVAFLAAAMSKPAWPADLMVGPLAVELVTWPVALVVTTMMITGHLAARWLAAERPDTDVSGRQARRGWTWLAVVALLVIYPSQAGSNMLPESYDPGGPTPWGLIWRSCLILVAVAGYAAVLMTNRVPALTRYRARIAAMALWFVVSGPLLGTADAGYLGWWLTASWVGFVVLLATMWRYRRPGAWSPGYWVPAVVPLLTLPTWFQVFTRTATPGSEWAAVLGLAVAGGALAVFAVHRRVAWWRQIVVTTTAATLVLLKYSAQFGPDLWRVQVASLVVAAVGAALAVPLHRRGLSTWKTMSLPAGGAIVMLLPGVVEDTSQFTFRFCWLIAVALVCIAVGMVNRWAAPLAAGVAGLIAVAGASFASPWEFSFMLAWLTCGLVGVTLMLLGIHLDGVRRKLATSDGVDVREVTLFR